MLSIHHHLSVPPFGYTLEAEQVDGVKAVWLNSVPETMR